MTNFEKWNKEFKSQNLFAFNNNTNGLLWLKTRAICRKEQLQQFIENNKIVLSSSKIAQQNIELFEKLETMPNAMQLLDSFLRERNNEWYKAKGVDEEILKDDLYKVQHYAWGGDQNNSLDKYLVGMLKTLVIMKNCVANRIRLQVMHGIMFKQVGIITGHLFS